MTEADDTPPEEKGDAKPTDGKVKENGDEKLPPSDDTSDNSRWWEWLRKPVNVLITTIGTIIIAVIIYYVTDLLGNPLSARFSVSQSLGNAPLIIEITDQSSNVDSYTWDFGEGLEASLPVVGTYVYDNPGTYNLSLYVRSNNPLLNVFGTSSLSNANCRI